MVQDSYYQWVSAVLEQWPVVDGDPEADGGSSESDCLKSQKYSRLAKGIDTPWKSLLHSYPVMNTCLADLQDATFLALTEKGFVQKLPSTANAPHAARSCGVFVVGHQVRRRSFWMSNFRSTFVSQYSDG
jgi:hypothetical protein